jgi:hypothetical protein
MKSAKKFIFVLIASLFLLTACGGGSVGEFICNIGTETYGFEFGGEDGPASVQNHGETTTSNYDPNGKQTGILVEVNRTVTFEDSGNSYTIVGQIEVDFVTEQVSYDVTATSDVYDEPQTCSK